MKTIKYDFDEEVFIKARVKNISFKKGEPVYQLSDPNNCDAVFDYTFSENQIYTCPEEYKSGPRIAKTKEDLRDKRDVDMKEIKSK